MTDEQQQLIFDYKAAFNTDAGVAVLKDLMRETGVGNNPYVEGSFDRTAQKCGKLAVGLYIQKKLASTGEPRQEETKTDERTQL